MQKSVYYSGQHTTAQPAQRAATVAYRPVAARMAAAQHPAAVQGQAVHRQQVVAARPVPAPGQQFGKAGLLVLLGCLVLAVMVVLLVPMVVGGAVSSEAQPAAAQAVQVNVNYYDSAQQAAQAAGISVAVLPAALPEGYGNTTYAVADANVLEVTYSGSKGTIVYRTAAGSDDLSGGAMAGYSYTATETIDGIARGYAGVSEKKLNAAVWACDGTSYALLAEEGLDAWAMRQLAESVK